MKNITKTQLKDLVYQVNGAAIEVHKRLRARVTGNRLSSMFN